MSSRSSNSLAPWRRSQSHTCRWISGSGARRRSFRGGKSPAGAPPPGTLRPLLPLLPHQEAVRQHHTHRMTVEPCPQAALVLIPAQQPFGFLMVLLHPVPPVGIAHQRRQTGLRPQVAPVVLAVGRRVPTWLLADQPAHASPAVGQDSPAAQGHEAPPQPALAALPPADRPPRRRRLGRDHRISPLHRSGPAAEGHPEIAADGDNVLLLPLIHSSILVRVIAVDSSSD